MNDLRHAATASRNQARRKRIAVVGGGIAGLATAYEMARLGDPAHCELVLFEASSRLGGTVETVHRDGFVMECGPDAWVSDKPWARELAIELGLEEQLLPSNDADRRTYILDGRTLVAVPDGMRMMVPTHLNALLGSPLFSVEAQAAYRAEPGRAEELKAAALEQQADESVSSFVRRHFGEEVAVKIAAPLLSGVFGGSIDKLSVRSVMPAFVRMEREHGSLIVALQQEASRRPKPETIFTSLRNGVGTLIDAMLAALASASFEVKIRRNCPVLSLQQYEGGWCLTTAKGAEQFDSVVLATPASVTRGLLAAIDRRLGELLDIEATSAIVVAFAFKPGEAASLRIPTGFGFLVPQAGRGKATPDQASLLACTFVDQKFAHRVPAGGVLLRAFFGGDEAVALMGTSDGSLVSQAHIQLREILGPLPQASFTVLRRWPSSLPQYAVGHTARVAEVESHVADLPGLHLVGNSYHGVGLPDLIRQGRTLGRKLVTG